VAALVGVGLWKPPLPRLVRIQGKMAITGDAMAKLGLHPKKELNYHFEEQLAKVLRRTTEDYRRLCGYHEVAMGDENSGVREVGGAGAYPSEVTGA
jgi:hypothetical protein